MSAKIVVVGDDTVGKTELATLLCNDTSLQIIDTEAAADYDEARKQAYETCDALLLCFSVADLASFDNVKLRWFPELSQFAPGVPIIVAATKLDLREDVEGSVTSTQGEEQAQEVAACAYIELSSSLNFGLDETLETIKKVVAEYPRKPAEEVSPANPVENGTTQQQLTQLTNEQQEQIQLLPNDQQAIQQGYSKAAGATTEAALLLVEKRALLRRIAELDAALKVHKLQVRCLGCQTALGFYADKTIIQCPKCQNRLAIEGIYAVKYQ